MLVGSRYTLDGLVYSLPKAARELADAFWPGALTLYVEHSPSLQWDLGDTGGRVMVRMPLHPVALEVLREVGPMAVTTANKVGSPAPATAEKARDELEYAVRVYLEALRGGPGNAKCRSLRSFADLLTSYLKPVAGHRLYAQDERKQEVCWYVDAVGYEPPRSLGHGGVAPAYAWARLLAPYAAFRVGAVGDPSRPHTVLAAAVVAPAPPDVEPMLDRLTRATDEALARLEHARPFGERCAWALKGWLRSKGERRSRAHEHRVVWRSR